MKGKIAIVVFSVVLAVTAFALQALHYHYMLNDLNLEVYIGMVAALFLLFGLWVGSHLLKRKAEKEVIVQTLTVAEAVAANPELAAGNGITVRELEVLQLIAQGHSNQEIADKLFVSLNTVKTHSSNLFLKLDVRRRTQAVQKAKELKLIS